MKNRKNHKCLVILVNNESDTDREKKAKKIIEVKLEKANQKYNATKEGRNIKQQVSLYTNTKEGQRKMVTLDVYGDNKNDNKWYFNPYFNLGRRKVSAILT